MGPQKIARFFGSGKNRRRNRTESRAILVHSGSELTAQNGDGSEDFSLPVTFSHVNFSWLFRGFFVALICLEKQFFVRFSVAFSWLFRGPHFGQIVRVLALEKSSEMEVVPALVNETIANLTEGQQFQQAAALEAQQRYFSYCAILVAIVSQNSFVPVFVGYRTIIARYVAKGGIAQMCLCETKYQGGVSHHFWGAANLP